MSSTKKVKFKIPLITSGDMSLASITSPAFDIQYVDDVCFQMAWSGTPTGSFDIQGSIDAVTWTSITLSTPVLAAGAAGNALVDMFGLSFPWIRIVYTKTSGSGTLNVLAGAKEI